ncbi:hypothetical protein ACNOYE_03055 [Nannocystaceae bacterium ST9]
MTPRRLQFVVGTGLLGASLTLGCADAKKADEGKKTINEGPQPEPQPESPKPEPPKPEPPKPELESPELESPEPLRVNEGPQIPPPEPIIKTNPGPEPVPDAAPEPKHVNTRPDT